MKNRKSTIALPLSIRNDRLAWLYGNIWQRPHSYNTNFSSVFAGRVGSGKSWLSLSFAERLDHDRNDEPRFSLDRVAFSAAEFANLVKQDWPVGTAICFDDCGLHLFSRESMVKSVKEVAKLFQCCRYKRQLYFLSLPTLGLLDKGVRMLLAAYIEPMEINFDTNKCRAKFQWMQTNAKEGDIYFKRPVVRQHVVLGDGYETFREKTVSSVWFDSPSKQLARDYEKRKKEVMDEYLAQAASKLVKSEKPELFKKDTFESIYQAVSNNKEAYYYDDKQLVDTSKILLRHGCGVVMATKIAANINRGLRYTNDKNNSAYIGIHKPTIESSSLGNKSHPTAK